MQELTSLGEPPLLDMIVWVIGCCAVVVAFALFDIWKRKKRPNGSD